MNITKLPSGNLRARICIGKDENGKYIYKSITAPTKKELLYLASQYEVREHCTNFITLREATQQFLIDKHDSLSPTTIRGYEIFAERRFQELMDITLDKITRDMVQKQINYEKTTINKQSKKPISMKYLKDMVIFYLNIMRKYNVECNYHLEQFKLGKDEGKNYDVPTPQEMEKIYDLIRGTDIELPVLLASRLSLRTSEIRGLKWEDITDGVIHIQRAKVLNETVKSTKTKLSNRYVPIPNDIQEVIDRTPRKGEFMFPFARDYIYDNFTRILKRNNMKHYTVHSLRHYFATMGLHSGVSQQILEKMGGWSPNSKVMSQTYQTIWVDKMKEALAQMEIKKDP